MSVRSKTTSTTSSQGSPNKTKSPSSTQLRIDLISEYAQGNITRTEATREITKAFRESSTHDDVTPEQVEAAIASFITMLDQAHSSRVDAARLGGTNQRKLNAELQEGTDRPNQPEYGRRSESPEVTEWGGSPQMAMGTGRVDKALLTWTADKDAQMFKLTPSQELM